MKQAWLNYCIICLTMAIRYTVLVAQEDVKACRPECQDQILQALPMVH